MGKITLAAAKGEKLRLRGVLATKPLDSPLRVNKFHLAGVVRMALRANVHAVVAFARTRLKGGAARAANLGSNVPWMNVFLHNNLSLPSAHGRFENPSTSGVSPVFRGPA